jgi:Zn-dependent protease with chaperone function
MRIGNDFFLSLGYKSETLHFSMLDNLIKYLEVNLEIVKLDAKEVMVRIISKMMKAILMMILGSFTLLFVSLAFAFYIDSLLGSSFHGFFIVGLFYLMLFFIFWLLRKKITRNIQESIDVEIPVKLEFEDKK